MLEGLKKLRGRSLAELKVRGAQAFAAFSERHGLSSQSRLPSDAGLIRLMSESQFSQSPDFFENVLTHYRERTSPRFFAAFDEPSTTRQDLRNYFGKERQALVCQADRTLEGRFQLLGFNDLDFGQPIDWHLEPNSGKRSPMLHWSRLDELDSGVTGDKKIIWELNRHQYFATLGRAYWVSGDEKYASGFTTQLSQWMDQNPPKLGLNWTSSLEVAFRAISWLWALHFFKDSTCLTPQLFARTLKYLYLDARHLETYLSTFSSPNTHLTGEALGLFYLGTILPEFRDATRWRETGRRILEGELERHVLEDGVYFERATYYHRYTTDFYTHFVILAERNHLTLGEGVNAKLQSLLDHLMYITRPDGTTPFIGDDDGGQLMTLDGREVNDFRGTLSTGAALFHRADYKFVAGEVAEATLWLLGSNGLRDFGEVYARTPQSVSLAFPEGGCFVMRDSWTSEANYLLLDCGRHGIYNCGHAHADALSFELAAHGRTLLVDSGTYTYTGSRELRDYFRSSAAHNTLTLDRESSSVPDGPFSWKQTANASILEWKSDARFDFFEGAHDGYERLKPSPAMHTRSVLFLKRDYWVMRDSVETNGAHHYDLNFHFTIDSRTKLETSEDSIVSPTVLVAGASGLQIFAFTEGGEWRIEESFVSGCYGERASAPICTFSADGTGARDLYSFLIPIGATEKRARARAIQAVGGLAFEIRTERSRDILMVGNGSLIAADRTTSDFKWAWARFNDDEDTLEELVLIDGHSFRLDGTTILDLSERVGYAVARRIDDNLRIEFDESVLDVSLPVDERAIVT